MISVDEMVTHYPENSYSNERVVEAMSDYIKATNARHMPNFDEHFFHALGVRSRRLFCDLSDPIDWWNEKGGEYPVAEEAAHAYQKLMANREPLTGDDKIILITNTEDVAGPNLGYATIAHLRLMQTDFVAPLTVTLSGEGCSGYISGLREADTFLRAFPERKVVVITAELAGTFLWHPDIARDTLAEGSQRMQRGLSIQRLLFGDGCSASYISSDGNGLRFSEFKRWDNLKPADIHLLEISNTGSQPQPHFSPIGFFHQQPGLLMRRLVDSYFPNVADVLDNRTEEADSYAIHTGSFKILKAVQTAINLEDEDIIPSANILRDYANMNSTTGAAILASKAPGTKPFCVFFGMGFSLQVAY